MAGKRVVVTQRFFDEASVKALENAGHSVEIAALPAGRGDGDLSHDELVALLTGAAAWIVGHARVTAELQAALPALEIISRRGVGYDRVDLAAARRLGKVVCIAAGGNDASVADHTIGLMLAVSRRFRESQNNMMAGNWSILMGNDLFQKSVGVIGLGRIGRSLVQRLRGFEARVLAFGGRADPAYEQGAGVVRTDLETLLANSDFVSLHAPLTQETRFIIDAKALALMKPGAFLINAARGGLVDDRALLDALKSGHLGGAGLDTFESEANPELKAVTEELIARPNVIATPHSAASSREGLDRTNMVASLCVIDVLAGRRPPAQCIVADGRPGQQA
ncbi:Hydroxyacid dehydrogenase [uncultured Defluviicoccus sp.]|uniref:Hydroxyacid dehydrogenase n=1 Tax=metagenome TaxID=256318 RepID=A0A380T9H4_9ZZZZ|nr:Hydroxyacid dehydrogenase [uncultured Defluviicoccus sp.]